MQSTSRQSWISQRPNFFIRPIGFICNFIPNSYWSFHRTFHSWILSGWRILRGKIQPYEVLVRFSDTFDWRLPLRSVKRWFACVINSICQSDEDTKLESGNQNIPWKKGFRNYGFRCHSGMSICQFPSRRRNPMFRPGKNFLDRRQHTEHLKDTNISFNPTLVDSFIPLIHQSLQIL